MYKNCVVLLLIVLFGMALFAQDEQPSCETKLTVIAKLIEIRGKFPPNDLYDYVYIFKYEIIEIINGAYEDEVILVGHYNPRIPRNKIEDEMGAIVSGDVKRIKKGNKHRMELILPMETYWDNRIIDEYLDDDEVHDRYFAVKCDKVK